MAGEDQDKRIDDSSSADDIFGGDTTDLSSLDDMTVEGSELLEDEDDAYDFGEDEDVDDVPTREVEEPDQGHETDLSDDEVSSFILDGEDDEGTEEQEDGNVPEEEEPEEKDPSVIALNKKIEARRTERRKKVTHRHILIALILLAAALVGLSFTNIFIVDRIDVEGNSYFTDDEIVSMAHATAGKNLIYDAQKGKIKRYLKKNPYIKDVKVKRKLPSTLVIKVDERKQLAAVPYSNEYVIIDGEGCVLRRTTDTPRLTVIKGIKIKKMDIGENMEAANADTFNESLKILNAMQKSNLYFKEISVGEIRTEIHIYDDLTCIGATDEIEEIIRKGRLQEILKTLFDRNIKRGRINVTNNGYASYTPEIG